MSCKSCTVVVLTRLNVAKRMQSFGLGYLTRTYNLNIASREFVSRKYLGQKTTLIGLGGNISRKNCSCSSSNSLDYSGINVKHDADTKRFLIGVKGLGCAYLEYEREDQLIILLHTEVPQAIAGRGYGKLLAKEVLEYVVKNDYQIEIHCEYVRYYVSKFAPKYIKYIK